MTELERLRTAGRSFVLLDVREDYELALARLPDVKHVPMQTVPEACSAWSRDEDIVVLCHHGARSERVAVFLRSQGFSSVANLAGGIDAWSREIDPTIPAY